MSSQSVVAALSSAATFTAGAATSQASTWLLRSGIAASIPIKVIAMTERTDSLIPYPIVTVMPDQPDDRLKAYLCGGLPKNHAEAIEIALSLAVSCLTCYFDPQGEDDKGKYAGEVIDNVTYLRLAHFEKEVP